MVKSSLRQGGLLYRIYRNRLRLLPYIGR